MNKTKNKPQTPRPPNGWHPRTKPNRESMVKRAARSRVGTYLTLSVPPTDDPPGVMPEPVDDEALVEHQFLPHGVHRDSPVVILIREGTSLERALSEISFLGHRCAVWWDCMVGPVTEKEQREAEQLDE